MKNVFPDVTTSTYEMLLDQLNFYPTSSQNHLNITTKQTDTATLYIFDTLGKEVVRSNQASENIQLDISHLSTGVYFIFLRTGNIIESEKVIKN